MFIKVIGSETGKIIFVNSIHIVYADALTNTLHGDAGTIDFQLTSDSFAYFLTCVEAQSALATEKAEPPSLKSRIAQALRWDFPQGALPKYLIDFLALPSAYGKQPSNEDEAQVNTALNELMIEGVVTNIGLYYYHAANAPKPSPDPSNATAETDSIPAESTAPIQDPNSAD